MRPVVRENRPTDENGNEIQYTDYKNARGELIDRLGEYCSYCEMHLDSSLAVEHVQPKKPPGSSAVNQARMPEWNNFLLACANCNSNKGNADVRLDDYLWPDKDNTFYALQYEEGGLVVPSHRLNNADLINKAEATIKLTGLDKQPLNDPAAKDRRWNNRRETWDIAVESKQDLVGNDTPEMRRQIVRSASSRGYWSIWMTVFEEDADMLQRLIEAFPGTCSDCFDEAFRPIPRNGGR